MMAEIIVAAVVTSAVFLGSFGKIARLSRRGQELVALFVFAVAIVSLTSIYYYCYVQSETEILGYFSAFLRSLFGAIAAVVNVSNDYAAIAPVLNSSSVLTLIYWFAIMLAVSAFVLAIGAIFGRRLIDSLRWRMSFRATRYLIVGCNEDSLALGVNIANHDHRLITTEKTDAKRVVRYLACPDDTLDLETMLARTQDFGAMVAEYSPLTFARDLRILGRQGIGRNGPRRNHLIIALPFYSDALEALGQIADGAADGSLDRHRLAIHAISDSTTVAKTVADLARVLDIQCLSQDELLIRSYLDAYPPYRFFDLLEAEYEKDFNVVIYGFRSFGQRFLDYLIQNGQFLGSRMKALLIDPDIETLAARYRHHRPALDLCVDLSTENADLGSMRLLDVLGQKLDDLDLILIDTADAGVGASRGRELVEDVVELVSRVSGDSGDPGDSDASVGFTTAAGSADCAHSLASPVGKPLLVAKDESGLTVFDGGRQRVFAYRSEVFSEENLINSALDNRARLVNYVYNCAPDPGPDCAPDVSSDTAVSDVSLGTAVPAHLAYPDTATIDRQWEKIHDVFTQDSNRATAAFLPALAALANKPPTYADLENPISADPDLLPKLAENEHLRWMAFHVVKGWQPLSLDGMEKECARRAQAAGEDKAAIKGFQKTARRQHACLVPFAEIDIVTRRYNQLLKHYGSTAPTRDFVREDTKIIRYLEWINSRTGYC
ncbi:MAG: hypothetical protein LBC35_00340 [Coriobacteriales bacterium]|jgi:hypothetical protein|nr:hypothetical protein [Coriobacteriales bacterium]